MLKNDEPTPSRGPGRPSKFRDDVAKAILDAIGRGATRDAAAGSAGIGGTTLRTWCRLGRRGVEPFAEFQSALLRTAKAAELTMAEALFNAGRTDWKAALAWLVRRNPAEWGKNRLQIADLLARLKRFEENRYRAE